jgi:hypothetical protein
VTGFFMYRFAIIDFHARIGAHPSDFCFGKSHQNHSLCRAWMHKCRDAMDGEERPTHNPSGSLAYSVKQARP